MNGAPAAEVYASLYAPTAVSIRTALPDVGDNLQAQLYELATRPTVDGCDRLAANLGGAQTAIRKLREALIREGSGDGR